MFNDNTYCNALRDQVNRFDGRVVGTEMNNSDFVKPAEAYGVKGIRAEGLKTSESALKDPMVADAPAVVEVPASMMPTPFEV